jgi:asparagine N-glycosylation enzyme membrane subunit Stt3
MEMDQEQISEKKWLNEILNRRKSMAILAYIGSMMNIKDSFNAIVAVTVIVGLYIIIQSILDFCRDKNRYDLEIKKLETQSVKSVAN